MHMPDRASRIGYIYFHHTVRQKTWCDARTRSAKRFAPLHRVKQGVAGIFNRPDTCQTAWICSNSIRVPNIRGAETSRKAKFSFFMPGPARFFCAARGGYMCISAGDKSEFIWVHAMFIFYSDAFKKSARAKSRLDRQPPL